MGVPQAEAEAIKQQLGYEPEDGFAAQAASRVVDATMAAFVDEVRGSLDYYLASTGSAPIARLSLTGGGARLAGLAARLQVATRLTVDAGNPMHSLTVGRTGLSPEQLAFIQPLAAVPVGLALGAAS
jgi:type IV pilus assembly protein PilM